MTNKKCHTVRTIPNSCINIVESRKIDTPNTQICDSSLSWLGTGTSVKSGRVKLVFWAQIFSLSEMMQSCKCFPYVSKLSTLTYNWANSNIIKNAITLNIINVITISYMYFFIIQISIGSLYKIDL
jgi:hypothetical protein